MYIVYGLHMISNNYGGNLQVNPPVRISVTIINAKITVKKPYIYMAEQNTYINKHKRTHQ